MCLPWAVIQLGLLFPIITEIEPPWIRLFDERNFSTAAPALESLLARDRVIHVAKVFQPNEPVQMIAVREALYISMPVLVQTARDIIRNPDVKRRAAFVGQNVHPVIVVAHANRN